MKSWTPLVFSLLHFFHWHSQTSLTFIPNPCRCSLLLFSHSRLINPFSMSSKSRCFSFDTDQNERSNPSLRKLCCNGYNTHQLNNFRVSSASCVWSRFVFYNLDASVQKSASLDVRSSLFSSTLDGIFQYHHCFPNLYRVLLSSLWSWKKGKVDLHQCPL